MSMSLLIYMPVFVLLLKLDTPSTTVNILSTIGFGIMLGSILPDLDAPDSKIMYGWWRPVGILSKYAFYQPLRRLIGHRSGHREVLHSLIGCILISTFFGIISLVLYMIGVFFMPYIWIGIPIGFLLHLVGDSFTYTGVLWFYPKGKPVKSTTITNSGGEYQLLKTIFILFVSLSIFAYFLLPPSVITATIVVGVSILFIAGLHKENPRISEKGNKRFSKKQLLEFYLDDVGGKRFNPLVDYGMTLKIEDSHDPKQKPYLVRIDDIGGASPIKRKEFASFLDSNTLNEGDLVEMQFFENGKKKRIYFILEAGNFKAFYRRDF